MQDTRTQTIAIAAAIFAARDLARHDREVCSYQPRQENDAADDRRTKFAIDAAISKAQRLVDLIEHKLSQK